MADRIRGASVFEQDLYDLITRHVEEENEILAAYQQLVDETDSPAFAYLADLIVRDEKRHHGMLDDLAETIRSTAAMDGSPTPIPDLGSLRENREAILEQTEKFLAAEEADRRRLKELSKQLKDFRNTTLWEFVVRVIQHDNDKHRAILEFIRDRARSEF